MNVGTFMLLALILTILWALSRKRVQEERPDRDEDEDDEDPNDLSVDDMVLMDMLEDDDLSG